MCRTSCGKRALASLMRRVIAITLSLVMAGSLVLLAGCGGSGAQDNGAATGDNSSPLGGAPSSSATAGGSNSTSGGTQNDGASASGGTSVPSFAGVQVGEEITFGTYNGQAITWRVLAVEGACALVITEDCITDRAYHNTPSTGRMDFTWEYCNLRWWLGNDFFYRSFNAEERARIAKTTTQNSRPGTEGSSNCTDRVFLLSIDEANHYFEDDSDRIVQYNSRDYRWWLRSTGRDNRFAAFVSDVGSVDVNGAYVDGSQCGVRPALWLNL